MRKIAPFVFIAMLFVFLSFVTTAFAANAITPDEGSILDLARPIFEAIVNGDWWLAAAGALVLVMTAARRYLPTTGRFGWTGRMLASTPGVMVSTFVMSFGGAVVTALLALGPAGMMSWAVAKTAALIGVTAIGAWKAVHTLAVWMVSTEFYRTKVPAWIQAIVAYVLSFIGSNAIAKAEQAGKRAVEENPASGVDGVIGKPRDIP